MAQIIAFVQAHAGVMEAAAIAVLDLIFALNPASESNGILHFIYLKLKALKG